MNDTNPQKIVAFGQIMHRLTPAGAYDRLVQAPMLRRSGVERGGFAGLPGVTWRGGFSGSHIEYKMDTFIKVVEQG